MTVCGFGGTFVLELFLRKEKKKSGAAMLHSLKKSCRHCEVVRRPKPKPLATCTGVLD